MTVPTLQEFLLAAQGRAFAWGQCDCALWVCDRVLQVRGVDPGAVYRGTYATEKGCFRVLRRNGGLLKLSTRRFAGAGLEIVDAVDVRPGDAACVKAAFGETLGLVASAGGTPRIAMKSERGVIVSSLYPILRAWRV